VLVVQGVRGGAGCVRAGGETKQTAETKVGVCVFLESLLAERRGEKPETTARCWVVAAGPGLSAGLIGVRCGAAWSLQHVVCVI